LGDDDLVRGAPAHDLATAHDVVAVPGLEPALAALLRSRARPGLGPAG